MRSTKREILNELLQNDKYRQTSHNFIFAAMLNVDKYHISSRVHSRKIDTKKCRFSLNNISENTYASVCSRNGAHCKIQFLKTVKRNVVEIRRLALHVYCTQW